MLSPLSLPIADSIFIFGIYPSHPDTLVDIPASLLDEKGASGSIKFRVLCHRRKDNFEFEYLFECHEMTGNYFWDLPYLEEQKYAVDEYWRTLALAVKSNVSLDLKELPDLTPLTKLTPIQLENAQYLMHQVILGVSELELDGKRENLAIVCTILETFAAKSSWKGPFLIVSESLSRWSELLRRSRVLKTLFVSGNPPQRQLLENYAFPVFGLNGEHLSSTYNYNVVIAHPKVVHEDHDFFSKIDWQGLVLWSNCAMTIPYRFSIKRNLSSLMGASKEGVTSAHWSQQDIVISELSDSE